MMDKKARGWDTETKYRPLRDLPPSWLKFDWVRQLKLQLGELEVWTWNRPFLLPTSYLRQNISNFSDFIELLLCFSRTWSVKKLLEVSFPCLCLHVGRGRGPLRLYKGTVTLGFNKAASYSVPTKNVTEIEITNCKQSVRAMLQFAVWCCNVVKNTVMKHWNNGFFISKQCSSVSVGTSVLVEIVEVEQRWPVTGDVPHD